jgi:rhodanese-related sulfurtransferase
MIAGAAAAGRYHASPQRPAREDTMIHSEGFLKVVNDAKSRVRETTPEEVRRRQAAGESFHFVDVREDNEWQAGRAAGAQHLGKGIIERDIEQAIPDKDAEIILYCGGGYRSALAADALQQMGYRNVISMDGGWKRWRELGYPTESGGQ